MKSSRKFLKTVFTAAALAAFAPSPLFACAACYGRSDSPLAKAMNWGIFTLMGVIVTVLVTIAAFFIYIIRKEAASLENTTSQPQPEI
jgi:heme/copper-type cytochrome/quinol oxidase subunit 2